MPIRQRYILFIAFLLQIQQINSYLHLPLKLIKNSYLKYAPLKEIHLLKGESLPFKSQNNKIIYKTLSHCITGNIKILDNLLLTLEIKLGSNEQLFNVILDTGSFILWIPEKNSKDSSSNNITHHYDPKSSSTSNKTDIIFKAEYFSGFAEGYFYYDQIKFFHEKAVTMLFGSANKTEFSVQGADGIMGLARKYHQNLLSSIFTMKQNGLINSGTFSIKFYPKTHSADLFIGSQHEDFKSKSTVECQLLSKSYYDNYFWSCQLHTFGLILNEINVTINTEISILFDTGTNALILPKYIISSISKSLKNFGCFKYIYEQSANIICTNSSNLPEIVIEIGNYYLFLNKSDMYYETDMDDGSKLYVLNIYFDSRTDLAIIGQPFFYEFHTMFDSNNNVLKFYNSNRSKIKKSFKRKTEKEINYSNIFVWLKVCFVFLVIIAGFLLGVLFWYLRKIRRHKNSVEYFRNKEIFLADSILPQTIN